MLFSSVVFILCFLPAVLVIYYIVLKNRRPAQNIFLLIASLGFYAWGEPKFVVLLMFSIVVNWIFGLAIDKYRDFKVQSRLILTIMAVFNLSILFVFKYLMFAVTNINKLLDTDFVVAKIMLPIGISFFTFHAISYVMDIYRRKAEVQKNPFYVGLYIVFFPQLVAGPILRYETIATQIMGRKENFEDFSQGLCRFLVGFGKKILLANNFALVADLAFASNNGNLSVSFAWFGAIAYTLQIYYDFSGYSDMAIGLGQMFGFKFPENFNYPYVSKSTTEFWRRWHISLGTWFRDYVYIPLGGSRVKTKYRLVFNLFVVWGLTGFWHGANWTFICWGLLYFITITLEKLFGFEKIGDGSILASAGKRTYTMLLVIFGWVLFRAPDIGAALSYIKSMLFLGGGQLIDQTAINCFAENHIFIIFGIIFSVPITKFARKWTEEKMEKGSPVLSGIVTIIYPATLLLIFFVSMAYLVKGTYNPFIYFNF